MPPTDGLDLTTLYGVVVVVSLILIAQLKPFELFMWRSTQNHVSTYVDELSKAVESMDKLDKGSPERKALEYFILRLSNHLDTYNDLRLQKDEKRLVRMKSSLDENRRYWFSQFWQWSFVLILNVGLLVYAIIWWWDSRTENPGGFLGWVEHEFFPFTLILMVLWLLLNTGFSTLREFLRWRQVRGESQFI